MKEKREIILFFTRLLMPGSDAGGPVWRDFWNDFCEESGYVPEICAGDLLLYYRLERKYSDRDVVVFQKEGTIVYRAYCGERER